MLNGLALFSLSHLPLEPVEHISNVRHDACPHDDIPKNIFKKVNQARVNFLYLITGYKKVHFCAHNFSVSLFISSEKHQFHHLDGCQAMGRSSSFIFAFWALCFLRRLCGFFLLPSFFAF